MVSDDGWTTYNRAEGSNEGALRLVEFFLGFRPNEERRLARLLVCAGFDFDLVLEGDLFNGLAERYSFSVLDMCCEIDRRKSERFGEDRGFGKRLDDSRSAPG